MSLTPERTREYDTTRLTHLLLRAVGWTPVDDGDYELVKAPEGTTFPDRVRFVSEGCALIVDADQVVAHKYASLQQPNRPQPPTLGEAFGRFLADRDPLPPRSADSLIKTCRQAALHYYTKPERTCAHEKEWVEGRNEEALAVDPDVLELAEHLAAFAASITGTLQAQANAEVADRRSAERRAEVASRRAETAEREVERLRGLWHTAHYRAVAGEDLLRKVRRGVLHQGDRSRADELRSRIEAYVGDQSLAPEVRPEVAAFSTLMETKLRANDHKGGWSKEAPQWLLSRLCDEVAELLECYHVEPTVYPVTVGPREAFLIAANHLQCAAHALRTHKGTIFSRGAVRALTAEEARGRSRGGAGAEAADVANFAMMLADLAGALSPAPARAPDPQPNAATPVACKACAAGLGLLTAIHTCITNPGCGCWACNPKATWFVVCGQCGNKRCPHADNHVNACTNSNEPGQVATPAVPAATPAATPERDFVDGNPPKAERRNAAPVPPAYVPAPPVPPTSSDEGARECVRNYTHDCQCPKHRGAPAHDTRGFNPNEDR